MKQDSYLFYTNDDLTRTSAKEVYSVIKNYLPPIKSMLELGCGMAAFSNVFQENGTKKIILVDHPSLDTSKCLIKENFEFIPCDLDKELPPSLKVDLVICTEVLEHINKKRAIKILDYINSITDLVLFSAAVPRQIGIGHINCQFHSYWIDEFKEREFEYSDKFKPEMIPNKKIWYYLRQNLFIFYRNQPENSPLKDAKWMDYNEFCISKRASVERNHTMSELIKVIPKIVYDSIRTQLKLKKLR